ncbi:MAG: hypothetical protein KBS81_05560, partial [Spirochaetales bacterium]|nr:hypothetical protein [Candidatus Physcosoma equi]
NVLFDKTTKEALCVVDLDTVMPGLAGHDFGDSIRSCGNTMGSGSLEFHKVALNLEVFQNYAEGFLSETGDILSQGEKATLAESSLVMTLELAARYLTDYLSGDQYFKVKYPTQNLDRARNLIALAKDMDKKMDRMKEIILSLS